MFRRQAFQRRENVNLFYVDTETVCLRLLIIVLIVPLRPWILSIGYHVFQHLLRRIFCHLPKEPKGETACFHLFIFYYYFCSTITSL